MRGRGRWRKGGEEGKEGGREGREGGRRGREEGEGGRRGRGKGRVGEGRKERGGGGGGRGGRRGEGRVGEERKERGGGGRGERGTAFISYVFQVLFRRRLQGGVVQHPLQTVLNFLEQFKLSKYCLIFQRSGMDGDLLLEASDSVLKELGVASSVDRIKLRTKYKTFVS